MHFKTILLLTVACSQHLFAASDAGAGSGADMPIESVSSRASASRSIPYVCSEEEDLALRGLEARISTMNKWDINYALGDAAYRGQQALVEWFLNRPEGQGRPDQTGINLALRDAAGSGHQALVELLLNRPEGQRPNQEGINWALGNAAESGHQAVVETLLKRPEGQLRHNFWGTAFALAGAARYGQQALVEWFLNRPEGQGRPDQGAIIEALVNAARYGHQTVVELLLNNPEGQVRLDQEYLNRALHSVAISYDYHAITALIANGCNYDDAFLKQYSNNPDVVKAIHKGMWLRRQAAVSGWHYGDYNKGKFVRVKSTADSSAPAGGAGASSKPETGAGYHIEPVD